MEVLLRIMEVFLTLCYMEAGRDRDNSSNYGKFRIMEVRITEVPLYMKSYQST